MFETDIDRVDDLQTSQRLPSITAPERPVETHEGDPNHPDCVELEKALH